MPAQINHTIENSIKNKKRRDEIKREALRSLELISQIKDLQSVIKMGDQLRSSEW